MVARSHDTSFWTPVLVIFSIDGILEWITWRSPDIFFYKCFFTIMTLFHLLKYYLISRSGSQIFWISLNQVLVCSVWYYWLLASDRGGSLFTPDISRFHARELSPLSRNFLSSRLLFLFHHFWYFHNSNFTFAELRWWTSHILAKGAGKGFGRVRKMRTRL